MDNTVALGIQPVKIDIATPLMQAAKIRQAQMETQNQDIQMRRDAIGAEARGLAPFVGKPEFDEMHAAAGDRLQQQGILNTPQAMNGWATEAKSPLGLQSLIARSEDPKLGLARQQFEETQKQHAQTFGLESQKFEEEKRKTGVAENAPITVAPGATLVHKGSGESVFSNKNGAFDSATLDAMADQYLAGDKSVMQNLGRGAQGAEAIASLRQRITERGAVMGLKPADIATKLQEFNAAGVGKSAEARVAGTREANLNLILKATEAAIPAALEASDKVSRIAGSFVPLNKIIQGGQVMTSNPELKEFGMANLQLAEHWARAMNPTGVMRESDRDKALSFLSTADSKDTYRRAVMQLKTQITRERDAVKGTREAPGGAAAASPAPAAAAGGGAPAAGGIPQGAIDMLKSNPKSAEQFDQIFGIGSAAKALGVVK